MMVPHFFRFDGYETIDVQTSIRKQTCEIYLKRRADKPLNCYRCGSFLERSRGRHHIKLETLSVMGYRCFVNFWREKAHCPQCKKARSEHVAMMAKETPHLTQDYAWWIAKMCEMAAVSRVAEFVGQSNMTVRRVDLERMQRMLKYYKIPPLRKISVDEVYARSTGTPGESRDERFFTVICDLETHRVVWVVESRKKQALDAFFKLIGRKACARITTVAIDQHEAYRSSVKEYCKNAKVVWDRFHLVQSFNKAMNEDRKSIHQIAPLNSETKRLTQGKDRYIFLKRASHRSPSEAQHIDEAMKANHWLLKMELIKERFISFFDAKDEIDGWLILDEVGNWIKQIQTPALLTWWKNLSSEWQTLKNYFTTRVSSALSEGINNTIKTLKRRAYGFRNMDYFRLKIMQTCGYLNSRYIRSVKDLNEGPILS